jgi:Histidine kinase-, DNA gyrase B-, and HSP90-like ATPase
LEDVLAEEWDGGEPDELDLTPSPRLLEVLGDIPYQPWQCLAELADNSFDEFMSDPDRDPADPTAIHITLPKATTALGDAQVTVSDNGRGMSVGTLQNALRAGFTGNARYGSLGLFGMGFNIATARLGNTTEVRTTRASDLFWFVVEINFRDLQRRGTFRVPLRREAKDDPGLHGTVITVRDLKWSTKHITWATMGNCPNSLTSCPAAFNSASPRPLGAATGSISVTGSESPVIRWGSRLA